MLHVVDWLALVAKVTVSLLGAHCDVASQHKLCQFNVDISHPSTAF